MEEKLGIVPLYPGEEIVRKAPPHAKLVYNGGPLLTKPQVFTIFLGKQWTKNSFLKLKTDLNSFFITILKSSLIDELKEYSAQNKNISYGTLAGSKTFPLSLPKNLSDSFIRTFLKKEFPRQLSNTLYFIFVEEGVNVSMGNSASCTSFCGYHEQIDKKLFYAVMPYPDCTGCLGGLSPFDALTSTSSHELCEVITDPIPGSSWYDNQNGEIGDICAWKTKKIGSYTVQLEWSNKNNACV